MDELPKPYLIGPEEADITFVGWGSTINVFLEAIKRAKKGTVNAIHIPCIKPLPVAAFAKLAKSAQKLVMVEGNANGQGANWIKQEAGIEMDDMLLRYDGRPFYAEDLVSYINQQK
jgi:2-oxoglutarate ferredoxin oxidoreductase subunit alpha